jgi:hypothetical protein
MHRVLAIEQGYTFFIGGAAIMGEASSGLRDDSPDWYATVFDDEWNHPIELRKFLDMGNPYWARVDWRASRLRVAEEIRAGIEDGLFLTKWRPGDPLIACPKWNRQCDH